MISNNKKLKDLENIDVIFFSAFDHNEGKNNHGLFQMFDFFRSNLKIKSVFVNTLESLYRNDIDIFNISHLGENLPLAQQINYDFMDSSSSNPYLWLNQCDKTEEGRKEYTEHAARILIKNLPNHKFIAIADKADIDLPVLELILRHFKSKVIILSAVNNTWTGYCAYPDEYNCDKFKTKEGCRLPCPAISRRKGGDASFLSSNYNATKDFVERNKESVVLNVGNKFSFQEASESFIFKDIEKVLIPLKNVFSHDDFEKLWLAKKDQRENLLNNLKQQSSFNVQKTKFIIMWSAHDIAIKRKGMDYFITSLRILKYLMKVDRFDEMLVVISAQIGDHVLANELKKLNIPVVFTGHIDKNTYNSILAASDVYCSTTLSDAGPRTTYEAAALATPVISFDKCNAADFVSNENGALVETYDVKSFAEQMYRFANHNKEEKKLTSLNMYKTYENLMDTNKLVEKWEDFFKKHGV
tara:strand:+ start:839 stop:2248 length:1410 start_codon:yes stop_codon:yes gene_type:complete